jgi:uncharacterized membrane-anchored protein YjiN (DUF445 family)
MTSTVVMPRPGSEALRARQLILMKRRATALLAAVTVVFVVVTRVGGSTGWSGYAQAAAEAAMVGGLADWFAVTALFRRPLGLPIPHTAIVVERKDQFAATLGQFIQESFLTPDVIVERVQAAAVVPRVAEWLSQPDNAERAAAEATSALGVALRFAPDEEVQRSLEEVVAERLDTIALAPLAGRALAFVTAEGRHDEVLDAALVGLESYLSVHGNELRDRVGPESPWWLPGAVEDRIFERLLDAARLVLRQMAQDHDHQLRRALDQRLVTLAEQLQHDPAMVARGEQVKHDLLARPEVRDWVASLWLDLKAQLQTQIDDPASPLRDRVAEALGQFGHRLADDRALRDTVDAALGDAVRFAAQRFDGEIADLVSGTIARWDAAETSRRLELLLGPDLQYIRINGTVVGALAGVALHALAHLIA